MILDDFKHFWAEELNFWRFLSIFWLGDPKFPWTKSLRCPQVRVMTHFFVILNFTLSSELIDFPARVDYVQWIEYIFFIILIAGLFFCFTLRMRSSPFADYGVDFVRDWKCAWGFRRCAPFLFITYISLCDSHRLFSCVIDLFSWYNFRPQIFYLRIFSEFFVLLLGGGFWKLSSSCCFVLILSGYRVALNYINTNISVFMMFFSRLRCTMVFVSEKSIASVIF